MQIIIFSAIFLLVKANSVSINPNEAVGTCSLQSGELLPDSACYDNCKDTEEQRHFLTCIEMACYCRKTGDAHPFLPPQQAAVPLNAGAVVENTTKIENISSTVGPTVSHEAANNTISSTEAPVTASTGSNHTEISPTAANSTGGPTDVTPKV